MKQEYTAIFLKSVDIPKRKLKKRVKETFETIFYGSEEERFYHEDRCGHGIHGGHRKS